MIVITGRNVNTRQHLRLHRNDRSKQRMLTTFIGITTGRRRINLLICRRTSRILRSLLLRRTFMIRIKSGNSTRTLRNNERITVHRIMHLGTTSTLVNQTCINNFQYSSYASLRGCLLCQYHFLCLLFLCLTLHQLTTSVARVELIGNRRQQGTNKRPSDVTGLHTIYLRS